MNIRKILKPMTNVIRWIGFGGLGCAVLISGCSQNNPKLCDLAARSGAFTFDMQSIASILDQSQSVTVCVESRCESRTLNSEHSTKKQISIIVRNSPPPGGYRIRVQATDGVQGPRRVTYSKHARMWPNVSSSCHKQYYSATIIVGKNSLRKK